MANILLVEDDVTLTEIIRLIFKQKAPYLDIQLDLQVVYDGEAALKSAKEKAPDLVLLDIMLPGIDGIETCRQLRQVPDMAGVPIILLTACSAVGDKRRGYEAGADLYFTKPFDNDELIRQIYLHLNKQEIFAIEDTEEGEVEDRISLDHQKQDYSSGLLKRSFAGKAPTVSVVVPTLNEADNLPEVLPWIPDWVDEVVLVDGHSTDGTVEVALSLRPDIKIIMQKGKGKGNALIAGFTAATGDIIVMLDADGSTDPAEIPAFVGALMAGADFAKGSRFLQGGGTIDMPLYRQLGNIGFVLVIRLLFGGKYTDLLYGYNAFWSRVLPLIQVDADGFEVETLMNVRALRAGLKITEIPSFEAARLYGIPKLRALPDGWRVLMTILREFNDHRIKRVGLARKGIEYKDRIFVPTVGKLFRDVLDIWRSHEQVEQYEKILDQKRDTYLELLERDYTHPDDIILRDYYQQTYGDRVPWIFAEEVTDNNPVIDAKVAV
jgi:DNA-binding response OmpR family regulator/glycosyltransferase involved in cell wall biosynthesis